MYPLETEVTELKLVKPDAERDAPLSVMWLEGDAGRETLRLMGNAEKDIKPTTLEAERKRLQDFLKSTNQWTWMIQAGGKTIGAVWIDLKPTEHLPAPGIHIMIGDPSARGKGYGSAVYKSIIKYLSTKKDLAVLYSRHLYANWQASALMKKSGFTDLGKVYTDANGLEWQNVKLELKTVE